MHSFYTSDRKWTTAEDDCACPDFSRLSDRHLLLFHSHQTGVQYYLGSLRDETFHPETHGHLNWPGGQLNAPQTMLDGKGRRLFWGWACEARTMAVQREAGWAGVLSLPWVLDLAPDGSLVMAPAPELEVLRHDRRKLNDIRLGPDNKMDLSDVRGDALELAIDIDPGTAEEVGLKVRCSPDGVEQTVISFRPRAGELSVDTRRSSLSPDVLQSWPRPWATLFNDPWKHVATTKHVPVQDAPFRLTGRERFQLRVFLDRSILEIFANKRQCLTQRIYPTRADSLGVRLFAKGGEARLESMEAWAMDPTGL